MSYKNIQNAHALKNVVKPAKIPDYHLMVGTAEDLSSQPLVHYVDFMPKQTYKMLPDNKMTYEDVQANLEAGTLTIDDFFGNVYPLGEAIYKV